MVDIKITRLPTEGELYTRGTTSFRRPKGQPYAASINALRCNGRPRRVRAMPSRAAPEPCSPASDLRPFQLPGALFKASIRVLFPSSPLNYGGIIYLVLKTVKHKLFCFDWKCSECVEFGVCVKEMYGLMRFIMINFYRRTARKAGGKNVYLF